MAGVACINCYELPPRCSHGLGGAGAAGCTGWNHDPEEHRQANGNYGAAFRQALPYEIHTLDGLHIDALRKRGQDGAIAPVRTVEQAELTAALAGNTMAFAQADVMMALMVEFPEEHVGIARNFNRLISGLTVAQTHQAALYFPQIRDAKAALKEQAEKEGRRQRVHARVRAEEFAARDAASGDLRRDRQGPAPGAERARDAERGVGEKVHPLQALDEGDLR
jgi:hypothetical protein